MKTLRGRAAEDLDRPELLGNAVKRKRLIHGGFLTRDMVVSIALRDPDPSVAKEATWRVCYHAGYHADARRLPTLRLIAEGSVHPEVRKVAALWQRDFERGTTASRWES